MERMAGKAVMKMQAELENDDDENKGVVRGR